MKSVVLYYSYTGHTKKVAEKIAHTQSADLIEVQTTKHRNMFMTFLVDCPRAMRRIAVPIKPIAENLNDYDLITLAFPVWASNPAPAFNALVKLLPKGKKVQLIMVSASGSTKRSEADTKKLIKKLGCTVVAYKDVKQGE